MVPRRKENERLWTGKAQRRTLKSTSVNASDQLRGCIRASADKHQHAILKLPRREARRSQYASILVTSFRNQPSSVWPLVHKHINTASIADGKRKGNHVLLTPNLHDFHKVSEGELNKVCVSLKMHMFTLNEGIDLLRCVLHAVLERITFCLILHACV